MLKVYIFLFFMLMVYLFQKYWRKRKMNRRFVLLTDQLKEICPARIDHEKLHSTLRKEDYSEALGMIINSIYPYRQQVSQSSLNLIEDIGLNLGLRPDNWNFLHDK